MADQPVAGWYPDPSGNPSKLRYWDGTQWTNDFADLQATTPPATGYEAPNPSQPYGAQSLYAVGYVQSSTDKTLRLIAFILCVLSTVLIGWTVLTLAWMIPMTVHCWGVYRGTKPNTVTFGVCTLIFLNLVGGILLLISEKDA